VSHLYNQTRLYYEYAHIQQGNFYPTLIAMSIKPGFRGVPFLLLPFFFFPVVDINREVVQLDNWAQNAHNFQFLSFVIGLKLHEHSWK